MIHDDPTPPYRIMLSSFGMVRKSVQFGKFHQRLGSAILYNSSVLFPYCPASMVYTELTVECSIGLTDQYRGGSLCISSAKSIKMK
jgi:hypothetical protein